MTALEILKQGIKTFEERGESYGDPQELFQKVATLFRVLKGADINAEDVALIMVLMKLAREQVVHKDDNLLDATVYTAIYGSLYGK